MNNKQLKTIRQTIQKGEIPTLDEIELSYYEWVKLLKQAAKHDNEPAGLSLLDCDYSDAGITQSVQRTDLDSIMDEAASNDLVEFGFRAARLVDDPVEPFDHKLLGKGSEAGVKKAVEGQYLSWKSEYGLIAAFARFGTPELVDTHEQVTDSPNWRAVVEALMAGDQQTVVEYVQNTYYDYLDDVEADEAIMQAVRHDAGAVVRYLYDQGLTYSSDVEELTRPYTESSQLDFIKDRNQVGNALFEVMQSDDVSFASEETLKTIRSRLCRKRDPSAVSEMLRVLVEHYDGDVSAETFAEFYENSSSIDDDVVMRLVPRLIGKPNMEDLQEGYRDHEHFLAPMITQGTIGSINTAFCWFYRELKDSEFHDELLLTVGRERLKEIALNIASSKTLAREREPYTDMFRSVLRLVDDGELEKQLAHHALDKVRLPLLRALLDQRGPDLFETIDTGEVLTDDLLDKTNDGSRLPFYSMFIETNEPLPEEHYLELLDDHDITNDEDPSIVELINRRSDYPDETVKTLFGLNLGTRDPVGRAEAEAIADNNVPLNQAGLRYIHRSKDPAVVRLIMNEYQRQEDDPQICETTLTAVFNRSITYHASDVDLLSELIDMGANVNGVADPQLDGSFSSKQRRQSFIDRTAPSLSMIAKTDFPDDTSIHMRNEGQYRNRLLNFLLSKGAEPDAQNQAPLRAFLRHGRDQLFEHAAEFSDLKEAKAEVDLLSEAIRFAQDCSSEGSKKSMQTMIERLVEAGYLAPEHVTQAVERKLDESFVTGLADELKQLGHVPPQQALAACKDERPDLFETLKGYLNRRSESVLNLQG